MKSALDIAKNALQSSRMRPPRIVYMKADLLNGVRNIGPSESQVLESTSKTLKLRSISNWSTICSRDLGIRIHWSRTRLAVGHVGVV